MLRKLVDCDVTKGNVTQFPLLTSNLLRVSGEVSMHLLLKAWWESHPLLWPENNKQSKERGDSRIDKNALFGLSAYCALHILWSPIGPWAAYSCLILFMTDLFALLLVTVGASDEIRKGLTKTDCLEWTHASVAINWIAFGLFVNISDFTTTFSHWIIWMKWKLLWWLSGKEPRLHTMA